MSEKPQKKPTYTSPKGIFKFPRLNVADTKFKAEGEFSTKLVVAEDDPGVQELINRIDKEAAESLEAAKEAAKTPKVKAQWTTRYLPYEVETDEEGNPTGNVIFKFTMKASGKTKAGKPWTRKPAIFDAKGKPMVKAPDIWSGTTGKISFQIIPYAPTVQVGASVKLSLNAVQVIELTSGGNRSASDYGFGEEDGYEYEEAAGGSEDFGEAETSEAASSGSDDEDF